MKKLTKKLNKYSQEKIEVQEFLTAGDSPEESFLKMVKTGVKCDGLVISGHHTGSFGGKNASGSLSVDFMEKLSCMQENKEFFNSIKALWLQGCRTLGVEKITPYDSADFHTERVGTVLDEDSLEQSFAQLNLEFSSTLDQDNPLSSRYLRVFPRATTFGWTKTAPGEKAGSQFSIPYHIAHMAKLNDDRGRYFDNPLGRKISKKSAVMYIKAVESIIGKILLGPNSGCAISQNGDNSIQSWINHGNKRKGFNYSFSNSDLNAYNSLFSSDDEFLKEAKYFECLLKTNNKIEEVLPLLDRILESEELIGYSFNSIYELMQRFRREGNIEALVQIQDRLRNSPLLNKFLMRKMASKELGIIRKIDYYAFWTEMAGKSSKNIEKKILDAVKKILLTPNEDNNISRMDFDQTLISSLLKHELIDDKFLLEVARSPEVEASALTSIIYSVAMEGENENESKNRKILEKLVYEVVSSSKSDQATFNAVAFVIRNSNDQIENISEVFNKIIESDNSTANSLNLVATEISASNYPIKNSEKMLEKIVSSKKSDGDTLASVAQAVAESGENFKNSTKLLLNIVKSPRVSEYSLQHVVYAIRDSQKEIRDADIILEEIMNSRKFDIKMNLDIISFAICDAAYPVENSSELIDKMINLGKNDTHSLESIAFAISTAKNKIDDSDQKLQKIKNFLKLKKKK